jgi:hypothetical protein
MHLIGDGKHINHAIQINLKFKPLQAFTNQELAKPSSQQKLTWFTQK